MKERIDNLTEKPITEFVPGDTIYISKMENGRQIVYFSEFVSYERGVVRGKAIDWEPGWAGTHPHDDGKEVKARLSKCYLWGIFPSDIKMGMKWPHCHWFDGKTKKVSGAG